MPGTDAKNHGNNRSGSHHHHTERSARDLEHRAEWIASRNATAAKEAARRNLAEAQAASAALDPEVREAEQRAARESVERTRRRIDEALATPCPESTCAASPHRYCFPSARGMHPSRLAAADDRIAAAGTLRRAPLPKPGTDADTEVERLASAQRLAHLHDKQRAESARYRERIARRQRLYSGTAAQ